MSPFLPMNEAVLSGGLSLFSKVASILMGLVSLIFMMRLSYLVVKVSGPYEYGELFKDTVSFLALLSLYPILLKLIISVSGDLALKISFIPLEESQEVFHNFLKRLLPEYSMTAIAGRIGQYLVLGLASAIYSSLMSLLIASGPIFIFLSTLLGMSQGLRTYFGLILSLSLWPIMWNILGHLALHVGGQFKESPLSSVCFYFVILMLQFLSPLFSYGLFRSMSLSTGVSKVYSIGRGLV